jgi:hypothetical protein
MLDVIEFFQEQFEGSIACAIDLDVMDGERMASEAGTNGTAAFFVTKWMGRPRVGIGN